MIQRHAGDSSIATSSVAILECVTLEFSTPAGVVRALNDVDLQMRAGDAVAITGPSGSGKSSLLSVLSGRERPTSGMATHPNGCLAMTVFQDHLLVPFLTVAENVRLAAELHNSPKAKEAEVDRVLDLVGVGSLGDRLPHEVSGGENQRVAIAQAVIAAPMLLLADEPTGSLDESNSRMVADLLAVIAAETGSAVVVATHSEIVASAFERRYRMSSGGLLC